MATQAGRHYVYWPDGKLTIYAEGGSDRVVYFGHPVKGNCIFGDPRPDVDTVERFERAEVARNAE